MKKLIFLVFFISLNLNSKAVGNNNDCKELKKFSVDYFKCKGKLVKDKTISTGQNIIKDTKDYQDKEWSEEKKKMKKVKEKIDKAKNKVLNK